MPDQRMSEERLQLAVNELNEIEHHTGWGRVSRIAEVVARHFLGGDTKRLHVGLRDRGFTIRKLAAHPECPLSKSQIQEVLAAFKVYDEDPLVREGSLVTPSHAAIVAKLAPGERRTLLERTASEGLSVRQLADEVRSYRRSRGERRGRPPTTTLGKAITRFENAALVFEEGIQILENASWADELSRTHLVHVLEKVDALCRSALRRCAVEPISPQRGDSVAPTSEVRRTA